MWRHSLLALFLLLPGLFIMTLKARPIQKPLATDQTSAAMGTTMRVSVASDGTQFREVWTNLAMSANGRYVAFESFTAITDHEQYVSCRNIYVHDRLTKVTQRISSTRSGQPVCVASDPDISGDGRYITFVSANSEIVSDDMNDAYDVFVYDQDIGQTKLVSAASNGLVGNDWSDYGAISDNGRFVVFWSAANNLINDDLNDRGDIFIHDLVTSETTLVSVTSNGSQSNGHSVYPSISADGRFVAFMSNAINLANNDTNGVFDTFVHDRETGQTNRVSVATNGVEANDISWRPSISADGRLVTFYGPASNLVDGDTNEAWDVFVHDRETGETKRISITSDGAETDWGGNNSIISGDGRTVTFQSYSTNLVDGDTNGQHDIFIHDLLTSETTRVSVATDGTESDGASEEWSDISHDGRLIAFASDASNLVSGDTNNGWDIFVRDRDGEPEPTSELSGTVTVGEGDLPLAGVTISAHTGHITTTDATGHYSIIKLLPQSYVLTPSLPGYFFTPASLLVTVPPNAERQDFVAGFTHSISGTVRDGVNGAPYLGVTITTKTTAGNVVTAVTDRNGQYTLVELPPGTYMLTPTLGIHSFAPVTRTVIVPPDETAQDFWGRNPAGSTTRVSVSSNGAEGNGESLIPAISADGRFVAFQSRADNLVSKTANNFERKIFVHDRTSGATSLVSMSSDGLLANSYSISPTISANGRFIAFQSAASNLVANDTNNHADIFVHDRITGETTRISVASDGIEADNDSFDPVISTDGRFVAFGSAAANLVPGDTNDRADLFLHNRTTGQTTRIPNAAVGGSNQSWDYALSADGRFVAFISFAQIVVYDRTTGQSQRVSVTSDGTPANGGNNDPVISDDGRFVAFTSEAINLDPADTSFYDSVYLHDRSTGETILISVNSEDVSANGLSDAPSISADGRFVVFYSWASNLYDWYADLSTPNIYLRDLLTDETRLVSEPPDGQEPNSGLVNPIADISPDGRSIVYNSYSSNLVGGDNNIHADIFVFDRMAKPSFTYSISGVITDSKTGLPLAGVVLQTNSPYSTSTNDVGQYTLSDLPPVMYLVTPTLAGYSFAPPGRMVAVPPDAVEQNFAGTLRTYAIMGLVTDSATSLPLSGVVVMTNSGETAVTDETGRYRLTELTPGTYTITPTLTSYTFIPPARNVTLPPAAANQDFTGRDVKPALFRLYLPVISMPHE